MANSLSLHHYKLINATEDTIVWCVIIFNFYFYLACNCPSNTEKKSAQVKPGETKAFVSWLEHKPSCPINYSAGNPRSRLPVDGFLCMVSTHLHVPTSTRLKPGSNSYNVMWISPSDVCEVHRVSANWMSFFEFFSKIWVSAEIHKGPIPLTQNKHWSLSFMLT